VSRDAALFVLVGSGLLAASFALSVVMCALIRRWALRLGFLDRPGGHKGHAAPIPLGGGVAIWLTAVAFPLLGVGIAFFGRSMLPDGLAEYASGMRAQSGKLLLILGLATLIMLMGLLDDRKALDWRLRLAMQFGLAAMFAQFGVEITLFGLSPFAGKILTIFWVVGLTNAFNFLDNMDGLAAGVGLIAALVFAGAQIQAGSLFVPAVLLGLVGALGGFLLHNRHPARLFMGDAGSNFLGFLLGALTVAGTYFRYGAGESPWGVLAPLLVMAVPLYDTTSVVLIRLREGRSPFLGDRRHFSHRLVECGLTPPQAVRTIYLVTLTAGLGSLLLHRLNNWGAAVVVLQTLCLLGIVAILEMSANRSDRTSSPKGPADVEA
jgi:UDP-GlcNAc:undecaprenyl-phosphate/decaprenyl-phosphate GlcNAc-1-phosphate transferase